MLHANVLHKSIFSRWSHCFAGVSALVKTAIVRRFLAAFLPMSTLASSSVQFLGLLHCTQLLCVTVVTSFQCLATVYTCTLRTSSEI